MNVVLCDAALVQVDLNAGAGDEAEPEGRDAELRPQCAKATM